MTPDERDRFHKGAAVLMITFLVGLCVGSCLMSGCSSVAMRAEDGGCIIEGHPLAVVVDAPVTFDANFDALHVLQRDKKISKTHRMTFENFLRRDLDARPLIRVWCDGN